MRPGSGPFISSLIFAMAGTFAAGSNLDQFVELGARLNSSNIFELRAHAYSWSESGYRDPCRG